jgi:hypothetical protein
MTYAFTCDVPINAETYARIKQGPGPERPPGLIAHLAWRTESGLRYVDVWRSKDDHEAFAEPAAPRRAPDPAGDARLRAAPSPLPPCSMWSTPEPTGIPADPPGGRRAPMISAPAGRLHP